MIYGFGGKLSGGKTCTAVRYCLDKAKQGKKIIANIRLNFPSEYKTEFLSNEDLVIFLATFYMNQEKIREKFQNSVLLLDEIVNLISARKSSSSLNELITNFFMMVGKLDCDVIYTFQVMDSQVDKRLREISQVYGNCYRYDSKGMPLINASRKVQGKIWIVVIMEYDFDILGKKQQVDIYDPSPFYDLYDTSEITLLDRNKFDSKEIKSINKINSKRNYHYR